VIIRWFVRILYRALADIEHWCGERCLDLEPFLYEEDE
jgi:hypothetical protein